MVRMKRAYEAYSREDGRRVLVERLWPRGVSKERAHLDAWAKQLAPSDELRRWYGHDPAKWDEFRVRYRRELDEADLQQELDRLTDIAKTGTLTLVYASRAAEISNAAVLCEVIADRLSSTGADGSTRADG